jgi:16S rRNA (guanine1207-N2)-methyltransferase
MEGKEWWSVPGLFGWDKIDPGSRLLLEHLPSDIAGKVADFGCGYGYLSVQLEQRYDAIQAIDAFDVDARAVTCCKRNGGEKIHPLWQDIRTLPESRRYDAIIMNPPFHAGKTEIQALGISFIHKAWRCLKPGGRLFLVANRHLAYEQTVPGLTLIVEAEGYKVLSGRAA